jgi:hypothetical protein
MICSVIFDIDSPLEKSGADYTALKKNSIVSFAKNDFPFGKFETIDKPMAQQ